MSVPRLAAGLAVVLVWAALAAGAAEAHALKVFAVVEGGTITGTAYFSGASRARGARIVVYGPDGAVLAEGLSDDDGAFSLPLGPRVDHRIVADSGDGHAAEFLIRSSEIAAPAANAVVTKRDTDTDPAPGAAPDASAAALGKSVLPVAPAPAVNAQLEATVESVVESVVARHVTPLRRQLDAYEDRVRWHDVLGGIGYIFGLAGIAAYVLSRRRP